MNTETRLEIYQEMLKRITNYEYYNCNCLCGALILTLFDRSKDEPRSIFSYPELVSQKPKDEDRDPDSLYWWPLKNKDIRIEVLNNAINSCKKQLEVVV